MNTSDTKPKKTSKRNSPSLGSDTLNGFLLIAPFTGILYLAYELFRLPFVPFDLFDWMTRVLPGPMVTFGIDLMIGLFRLLGINVANSAKSAEQFIAVFQFMVIMILICIVFYKVVRKRNSRIDYVKAIFTGSCIGLPFITISIAIGQSPVSPILNIFWLLLMFNALGLLLRGSFKIEGKFTDQHQTEPTNLQNDRRKFLYRIGGISLGLTVLSSFGGRFLAAIRRDQIDKEMDTTMAHLTETGSGMPFPNLNDPVMPAPGTRPEYTPIKDHYKVFIRTEPTVIEASSWKLQIAGMVDNPMMLSLDDLKTNYNKKSQYVTISCISGRIGTGLIGTTLWSGAGLQDVLADAGVNEGARYLHIRAGDGFYETVDLDTVYNDERIMLCYDWDGRDLPVDHGFPLRIWLPDRYGMKQPKWITGIEVTDQYIPGYWVERNWDKEAIIKTTSVIDSVAVNAKYTNGDKEYIPVGGIAFAGARGISKVEVRVDGGEWNDAKLRAPLSKTTWVIWRYDWPAETGEHVFEVRCAEMDGTPQIEEKRSNRPSGATGIHSIKVTI